MFGCRAKQDLFLKCIRATLRTDLAIIQRRLVNGMHEPGIPMRAVTGVKDSSKTNGGPKTRFTGAEALIRQATNREHLKEAL
jgi:hypothetical protein